MVSTISPTFLICAAHWSLSSNHFPSPAKGEFFFIVLQAGFAGHLLLLGSGFIFKNACVGQGLYLHWGHTFAPCPFGFNPSLAQLGAGRVEAVAQLLESLV